MHAAESELILSEFGALIAVGAWRLAAHAGRPPRRPKIIKTNTLTRNKYGGR